jgi:hypothetical protein
MAQTGNTRGQTPLGKIYASLASGGLLPVLQGVQQSLLTSQRHGPLYESAYAAAQFLGANQALDTTSAALAAAYTGLCLSNPAGSGVNLILERVAAELEVAPAAETSFGLIAGWAAGGITVHTTPLTPHSAIIGGAAASLAKLDAACTLVGTPAWVDWLGVTPGATSVGQISRDYQGGIIIPPGGYVAIGTGIAGPAAGFRGSFQWEEAPG